MNRTISPRAASELRLCREAVDCGVVSGSLLNDGVDHDSVQEAFTEAMDRIEAHGMTRFRLTRIHNLISEVVAEILKEEDSA